MKKLSLLLFISTLVLFSCKKDDDESNTGSTNDDLVGTWHLSGFNSTQTSTYTTDGETTEEQTQEVTGTEFDSSITFTSDPNEYNFEGEYTAFIEVFEEDEVISSFEYGGNPLFIYGDPSGEWKIEDGQLFLTSGFITQYMTIETLNDNTLILSTADEQVIEYDGQTLTITQEGTYTFTK